MPPMKRLACATTFILVALVAAGWWFYWPIHQVQTQVKRGLNDPDSAQFSNVTFSRSTKAGCGLVNARNRMGGDVGATAFVLTSAGDVSFEPREGVSLSLEDKLASLKEQLAFFEFAAKHCPN
jgi:hypothetical protein